MATTEDLLRFGLGSDRMSSGSVIERIATFVISIVVSVLFAHIDDDATRESNLQRVLIALSATAIIFWFIRVFTTSRVAEDMRTHSRDYWRLVAQWMQLLHYAPLFLVTHFIASTIIALWKASNLTPTETGVAMWCTFVVLYFAIEIVKKPFVGE
jgi:Na+/melibiose symporter-like transporter